MNSSVKNVLVLTIITVVAGLGLGYVYDITKEPIAMMEEKTKQEAYQKVYSEASSFEAESIDLAKADAVIADAGISGVSADGAVKCLDGFGNVLGHVYTVTTHEGYGGDIQISVGIAPDGTVKGMEILSISETAGLGMKADTDEFKNQFKDKNVAQFSYTKTGAVSDFEIDALSGATITTKAVTNATNAVLALNLANGGAD